MPLQLLIVGQMDRAEARPLAEWLTQMLQPADVRQFPNLQRALDDLNGTPWIPDLVVIIQSWPDEHSADQIDQLSRLAPLARCVVCYGSWCESDGRTRNQWPLAVRVPLRSATSRLLNEWKLLHGEAVRAVPMSASREEAFGIDHPALVPSGPVRVIVRSPDPEYRHYLCELLVNVGHSIVSDTHHGLQTASLVQLIDLDPWDESRRGEVVTFRGDRPIDRMIGLTSFSSPTVTTELLGLGIAAVLPKLGTQQMILDSLAD